MRTKKALFNSITSLALQLITIISGLILPRLIIASFGSEVNGAVSSITQFLSYIALLEAGVGGVTRAALYKSLANRDSAEVSGIVVATQSFFNKIAYFFVVYVVIIACFYKAISGTSLTWLFSFGLVMIIGFSTFAQYYFGITYSIVLQADQCQYFANILQISYVVINTLVSVILINVGAGIHLVKLVSTLIFVCKPLFFNLYVKKKYSINTKQAPNYNAIKQRWNGLGQHIAFFVHSNTDILVITVFLGLKWVSVYAVYLMVVGGIKSLINSLIGGAEAAFGDMIAKGQDDILRTHFSLVETLTSLFIVTLFGTTLFLLQDFISLYTVGVKDIDYHQFYLGVVFVLSEALFCIRQIYQNVVLAAGHYKETQISAFIEAAINIALSIVLVNLIGIEGVLIATIVASLYRIITYVMHLRKYILKRPIGASISRYSITIVNVVLIVGICTLIPFSTVNSWNSWIIKAIEVFIINVFISVFVNAVFFRNDMKLLNNKLRGIIKL